MFPVIEFGLLLKYSLGLQFMIQLIVGPIKGVFSQGIVRNGPKNPHFRSLINTNN